MVGDDGGIPSHFRYLFKHFKTVPNANPTLYADVFAPITVSDVNTYIARAKKGTAPGRTGLTIDMLNLASTEVRSDIATLLCLCPLLTRGGRRPGPNHPPCDSDNRAVDLRRARGFRSQEV